MTYADFWKPLTTLYDEGEAKAIARLVLEEHFGLTIADMLCGKPVDETELQSILRRLLEGEPVQYILGQATFCGRQFHVEPGVLIPRPETQGICKFVEKSWGCSTRKGSLLDIGTGSGCIACTLALDMAAHVEVTAWDISDEALRIARLNADKLGANVRFEKQDALRAPEDLERWDAIVSNPPYICLHEKADMERNVTDFEPSEALFVPDNDPLLFYRSIAHYAAKALKPNGFLLFEINTRYGAETANLLQRTGYCRIQILKDMFDKDRFVLAYKS